MAGEPGDVVKSAVQKLAEAPNYSWRMTTATGGDSRFTPGPVEGQTEKGGLSHLVMTFGEHSVDAIVKNGQVVVKNEDGWSKPEDRKPPPGFGPPPPPPPPRDRDVDIRKDGESRPEGDRKKDERKDADGRRGDGRRRGSKGGFLARRLLTMQTPVDMAADLTGKVSTFKTDGDGISGDLSAAAVRDLLTFGGHRREGGGGPPEPANPRGSVKFWVKEGALNKMEVRLSATLSFNGNEVPLDRTTVVEFTKVGTTQVEVPAEARKLLETDPASPKPEKKPD
jgi:hypothetical protein